MTSLSFPDINVWLALVTDHVHHGPARQWWATDESDVIAFSRFTQIGLLRLLTTAAVMGGKPLSMTGAWAVYDRLLEDERVALVDELNTVEKPFREYSSARRASPKLWADAYLLALSQELGATLVTFDRQLARRGSHSRLLA